VRLADYLSYTWRNLARAQLRLVLTVAAVLIGATLVVVMTSVGGGIQRNVLEDIRASGGLNEIGVTAAGRAQPGGAGLNRVGALNETTIQGIEGIDGVAAVLPQLLLFGAVELRYDDLASQPLMVGIPPARALAYGFTASQGAAAPEPGQVVLGARVAEGFFDANRQRVFAPDLFGQTLTLIARRPGPPPGAPSGGLPSFGAPGGAPGQAAPPRLDKPLQVVGILQPLGTQDDFVAWLNVDDVLQTLEWLNGRAPDLAVEGYHSLRVKAVSTDRVRAVQRAIGDLDLQATSPLSVLDDVNRGMLILQALLGTIGLVALIVSGLGVANTMLMATFERTREIGVLKALGATDGQIARLFLVEASAIGLVGALLGLLFGWLVTQVINLVVLQVLANSVGAAPSPPRAVLDTPSWVAPAVLLFAWGVAVLAGLYPALRAARLNVAQALRAD